MNNEQLRDIIREVASDDDAILLEGDEFSDGAIGLTNDNHVVYDYEKLIESLVKHNGWTEEEAIDWVDYNTLRSIPYMARDGKEPIILMTRFSDYSEGEE